MIMINKLFKLTVAIFFICRIKKINFSIFGQLFYSNLVAHYNKYLREINHENQENYPIFLR